MNSDKYEKQRYANILAFLTSPDYTSRREVLETLCRGFKESNVTWCIAMSCSLFFRGITDDFNDFDILLDLKDVPKFEEIFRSLGGEIDDNTKQKPSFSSPYYKEAVFKSLHFDLIGDMTVDTYGKSYKYVLQKEHISYKTIDGGLTIPLAPVEANYLLYAMMTGWQARRIFKQQLSFEYLLAKGIKNMDIFDEIKTDKINNSLPKDIEAELKQLLD